MAAHTATLIKPSYNTSNAYDIDWSSFASGANNIVFNVNGVDASKMIILVAGMSTLANSYWIGTSDSRSSHTSMNYPYSAGKLGRVNIKTTACADANKRSRFRSTVAADTEVFGISVLGPFETARYKDSDGYINVCRGKQTAGAASHSSDTFWIAGILIP